MSSDHRTLFASVSLTRLFATNKQDPLRPIQQRKVRSNDQRSVTTFIEAMHSHLLRNNAFNLGARLETSDPMDASSSRLVETIDIIIGQAGDHGEKKCCPRRKEWYSVPLVRQRLTVSYLKHYLNGLLNQKDRSSVINLKLSLIDSDIGPLPTDIGSTRTLLRNENSKLTAMKQTSKTERSKFLTAKNQPHDARRLNKHETALTTWRTVAFLKSSSQRTALDKLEIPASWPPPFTEVAPTVTLEHPKSARTWTTVTDPTHIEYYLLLRNRLHFGQAHGTPFTTQPLSDDIPWGASSQATSEILSGTYVPHVETSELCKLVLEHCKQRHDHPTIDTGLTMESFRGKIRKWREATTTSPSGRHLGRYKALFSKGVYTPEEEAEVEQFASKQSEITKLILIVVNFCIQSGHVLDRWKTVVNTMIPKDVGNVKIHRLRVIHIYEADLNLLMAVKWRDLLRSVDAKSWINDNQFGARPGCEASALALYEELRNDIAFSTRRTMASVDNDADSCYDRMIPSLISLNNRAFGMPYQLTHLHGEFLRNARYRLRTAQGTSNQWYCHSNQFPIYGTGQGSGNSPVLWMLMSAILFDIYETRAHGACIQDPTGSMVTKLGITGFVDDTNTFINDWHPQRPGSTHTVLSKLQRDAQLWNDLLYTSGGKLELTKCSFHTITFEFDPDGTPRVSPTRAQPVLITDPVTGTSIPIKSLSPYTPHKTLGHWKSPAGSSRTQLTTLTSRMQDIRVRITTSSLSRYGSRLAYQAIYLATLRYVLPQCHFRHDALRKAGKKSMPALIAKCGFSRKTATQLLYAPIEYGGGGFVHWDIIQSEGQIMHFIKHWRTSTPISVTLRIALSWCQWQAGTAESILYNPRHLPYLEARWIPSLCAALRLCNASIILDQDMVPKPQRLGDTYIMDVARESELFNDKDMRILNYCRLYLHVTTVSELFDADGMDIMPHMRRCERPPWFDPLQNVTIQQRPSNHQVNTKWNNLCQLVRNLGTNTGWLPPLRLRRESYQLLGDVPTVYHWHRGCYWQCSLPQVGTSNVRLKLDKPTTWVPSGMDCVPIRIHARVLETIYTYTDLSPRFFLPRLELPIPLHFEDYVSQLEEWARELLQNATLFQPPETIITTLKSLEGEGEQLLIVSDGSSIDGRGMSFGVTIGSTTGSRFAEISGAASGPPSSHRAESTGCLAGAVFLVQLCKFTASALPLLHVQAISDNQGMIRRLRDRQSYQKVYPNSTMAPDWDILEEIVTTYRSAPIASFKFEWERGHQDRYAKGPDLSYAAQFNIRADELATEFTKTRGVFDLPFTHLYPTTRCCLEINGKAVHNNFRRQLRHSAALPPLLIYMRQKHSWEPHVVDTVNWEAFRTAARNYSSTEVHLLKLVHDRLPLRDQVSRFQPWIQNTCHYCDASDTMDHLQKSSCNPASATFRRSICDTLMLYLDSRQCPSGFCTAFLAGLRYWLYDEPPTCILGTAVFDAQQKIGWRLLIRGFIAIEWTTLLQHPSPQSPQESELEALTTKGNSIVSGAIKIFWAELGTLWIRHLETIHDKAKSHVSPVSLDAMRNRVRMIHSLKARTLPMHSHYFHDDVETYLQGATLQSMTTYVHHYFPVIQASLTTGSNLYATESIQHPHPVVHHQVEEPSHRKRNRRRTLLQRIAEAIRSTLSHPQHPPCPEG